MESTIIVSRVEGEEEGQDAPAASRFLVKGETSVPSWTFITNHGAVLAHIARHGQITAREIASELGITERSVHRIISDLEEAGYLSRHRDGRVNRYEVNAALPLRHPDKRDTAVGELLKVLLTDGHEHEAKESAEQ